MMPPPMPAAVDSGGMTGKGKLAALALLALVVAASVTFAILKLQGL
jgi:hypothetical protein